uniref:Serine-threonine/tyrosine-protein kinase catalytic domain-containing protein n=1 Tax=Meloidogyne enterolobii TaxID=390850 RepID=A0A6V7U385_MELEN|nr:unnamed protein product [Meloidogyne enterolobii]
MDFNDLWKISYFHGMIDRHDAADLLKTNGEFLLRYKLKDETNVLIITSIQNYQLCCDVWSFGALCFEIFEGQEPYKDIPDKETATKIVNGQFLTPKDLVTNIVGHIFIDEKLRLLIHQIMPKLKNLIKKYEEEHKLKETKNVKRK